MSVSSESMQIVTAVRSNLETCILGKTFEIKLLMTALLAGGHVLIEDVPGTGKTQMIKALARSMEGVYRRVQCNPDLLPTDITGVSIYHPREERFQFRPGPIMSHILLADEINRATPKTQSGLLEAMEERQVSADGVTRPLPEPFFVIATQNPAHQVGTFPLPESQLDRFLMCLSLGYPDAAAERALLMGEDRRAMLRTIAPVMQPAELMEAQRGLRAIHASGALIDYLQALAQSSRSGQLFAEGLSPRATLALLQAARAWAALEGRDHVIPEDIQTLLVPVCAHRLRPLKAAHGTAMASRDLVLQLQKSVPV